jgi:TolB-like protein/tetratricopeptide (TPR) repeat protein
VTPPGTTREDGFSRKADAADAWSMPKEEGKGFEIICRSSVFSCRFAGFLLYITRAFALLRDIKMLFWFNNFSLDTARRELRWDGQLRSIEPQVFDLLEYLLRNRDRVVTRDDLLSAVWSGRIVSEATLASRMRSVRLAVGDSGDEQRLIRTVPRKGFHFVGEVREEVTASTYSGAAASPAVVAPIRTSIVPDRPSIAVLPFTNMSGELARGYLADGLTEDIITGLSRIRWLAVLAGNTTFAYKDRAIDVKQVGRELGVRYVFEGSVRQSRNRMRITSQLIDAATGAYIWAERFDSELADIFDLQDHVTMNVVRAIATKIEQAESECAKRKSAESFDVYDHLLRGMANFHRYTKEATSEALRLFRAAINLDPSFALPYGMAAWCYSHRFANRWTDRPSQEAAEATQLGRLAVELGHDDPLALCSGGWVLSHCGRDPDAGAVFIDRARALNPNLATAWWASGWVRIHLGDPERAISHFAHAMRINPLDRLTFLMQTGTASAHFYAGRCGEASLWAERALREKPDSPLILRMAASNNALVGRLDRAQRFTARLREVDPTFRVSDIKDLVPFAQPLDVARFEDGMQKSGLPE